MLKETQRMTGTVKWYSIKKGFGFITPDIYGEDIFLHRSELQQNGNIFVDTGVRVSFNVQHQEKGPVAVEIKKYKEETLVQQLNQDGNNNNKAEDNEFAYLELIPSLISALNEVGYVKPTPIQSQAIPIVLNGRDLLGCAQTGTGKTAAFALPILQRFNNDLDKKDKIYFKRNSNTKIERPIKVLVLTPTRELAIQVKDSFNIYGKYTQVKSTVIYGGVGQDLQVQALKRGVDVIVATPGRLLDLMAQGYINLGHVEVLVLDEADRMLDMGFIPDVRRIIKKVPNKNRQTLFFSATLPREIIQLADNMLNDPVEINISPEQPAVEIIEQSAFFVSKKKKQALLEYLLEDSSITRALVFTRTKHSANHVVKNLQRKYVNAETIHGDKSQFARQNALKNFRKGKTRVLVATDVASRGIDVDNISHVIQFDLPDEPKTYVHRIGRTGRAGAGGTAFAFCEEDQKLQLRDIERFIRNPVKIIRDQPYHINIK
jgi:ATP-dependent RNA helicase RhlE